MKYTFIINILLNINCVYILQIILILIHFFPYIFIQQLLNMLIYMENLPFFHSFRPQKIQKAFNSLLIPRKHKLCQFRHKNNKFLKIHHSQIFNIFNFCFLSFYFFFLFFGWSQILFDLLIISNSVFKRLHKLGNCYFVRQYSLLKKKMDQFRKFYEMSFRF